LADAAGFRRAAEILVFGDGEEVAEVAQIHRSGAIDWVYHVRWFEGLSFMIGMALALVNSNWLKGSEQTIRTLTGGRCGPVRCVSKLSIVCGGESGSFCASATVVSGDQQSTHSG
jgi:hypothetical protein